MERKTFLDALEVVEPAIAGDQATLPILTHLWFDKETVMAFNDVVALRAPLATPVAGGGPWPYPVGYPTSFHGPRNRY